MLGALLLVGDAYDDVANFITEDDFFRAEHRYIFHAIQTAVARGDPIDAVTLSENLRRDGVDEQAGGAAYLLELAANTASAANIVAWAKLVRDNSTLRKLMQAGTDIVGLAGNTRGLDAAEAVAAAEQRLSGVVEGSARGQRAAVPLRETLKEAFAVLAERAASPDGFTGLQTGYADLDRMTLGLRKQDLVVLAGRPSMGKTSLALNVATHAALDLHQPVMIFSLEMSAQQLAFRMLSAVARVDQMDLQRAKLDEADWARVSNAASLLSSAPVYIDDTPALSPTEIYSRARRVARQAPLGLVVVDYMQLMQIPGTRENRATEISTISRGLKTVAKEMDTPLLALSQLNRAVEQRNDKRPVMSDLRESGAIEQDADLILFIYRDEVYNKDSRAKGTAELIIGKQRNGPVGTVRLAFNGRLTRFENYAPEWGGGADPLQ